MSLKLDFFLPWVQNFTKRKNTEPYTKKVKKKLFSNVSFISCTQHVLVPKRKKIEKIVSFQFKC